MCTQYLHHIHLSTPCPHLLLTPICTNLSPLPPWPREDLFHSPVLQFCKRKKKLHFYLFKIATQGVSLWYFHVYMYHSPSWFFSIFLLFFYLCSFLIGVSTGLRFYIHSYLESISTRFTFLTSFFYPPPLICNLSLVWTVFHNIVAFSLDLYSTYERKHTTFGLLHLSNFT
jgi:hypothetical protein